MKKKLILITAIAIVVMLFSNGWVLAGGAEEAAKPPSYTVSGYVNNPGAYTVSGSLWTVLEGTDANFGELTKYPYQYPCYAGSASPCISLPEPPYALNSINHNWVDSNYVIVRNKSGVAALYSVGELNPKFSPSPDKIAITCSSKLKRCDMSGAGRTVKNISTVEVAHAVSIVKASSGTPYTHFYSPILIVSGEGIVPETFDLADLKKMKQVTFDASKSTTNTVGIWNGPTLLSLLKAVGVDTKDMYSYIVVQATDGYAAVISMYEATQKTGAQYALLAISDTLNNTINCDTTCKKGDGGLARLVLPNDLVAGRWISNVANIIVYKSHH